MTTRPPYPLHRSDDLLVSVTLPGWASRAPYIRVITPSEGSGFGCDLYLSPNQLRQLADELEEALAAKAAQQESSNG